MTDAFYRPQGSKFCSTEFTTGPWDPTSQHGGPPTALLVRCLERTASEQGMPYLARVTVELLRPVPVSTLEVATEVTKAGRSVSRLAARISVGDQEVARATALAARTRPIPVEVPPFEPPPAPDQGSPFSFPFFHTETGYHTAMDLRLARGSFGNTPTFMWMRARIPLLEGEGMTPAQRVALTADSGNGVSPILDWNRYSFINPDLTVAWHRPLEGVWVGLDATTQITPELGVGTAYSVIHDEQGPVGLAIQSLLCDPIRPED